MDLSMIIRRHVLPAGLSAGAAAGVAELGSQIGHLGGKVFAAGMRSGLNPGPSAIIGAISGIFYSVIYDILPQQTGLQNLLNHTIAIIGSAVATYGVAFAAASAGLIAMPSLIFLSVIFVNAISVNIIFRAVFGGRHPHPVQPKSVSASRPGAKPWIWPSNLSTIKINSSEKRQLDAYLEAIQPDIANGIAPAFHRKNRHFSYKGKSWNLPRTLSFVEDPRTRRVAAILLTVNNSPLGKGRDRTPKMIYNLTTGECMCKKKVQHDYELELMKSLNNSKGIEPLSYVRKVKGQLQTKTQLITPLYKGTIEKLLNANANTALSAKDIKRIMLNLLNGLEKLHLHPGKGLLPTNFSYHSDIKPANLLYKLNAEGYEAVISDFETVNYTEKLWGTPGWMSPEKVRFWTYLNTNSNIPAYNERNGQSDDMWSIGGVFASLLKNQLHEMRFGSQFAVLPPLACIYRKCRFIPNHEGKIEFLDRNVANVTQQELDQELAQFKADTAFSPDGSARQKMWDIAKSMLLVNSNRRLKARQAREALADVLV